MKKKFFSILLSASIAFTGCGVQPKQETSDLVLTQSTDPYGQTFNEMDSSRWTTTDKFPVYLKYGKKYIKFKSIEGYYIYMEDDYTYGAYVIITIDRKNLSSKDIRFLTDEDEDDLDISFLDVASSKNANSDDSIRANFAGGRYDNKIWSLYYYFSKNFRNKPKTFYVDFSPTVKNPNSDITNYCSALNFKLKNKDLVELDSTRYDELNECLKEVLKSAKKAYTKLYNDTFE